MAELAMPAVSVVVPTRDRAERLRALISALGRQTLPLERFELVVVDDGSSDATASVLANARARASFSITVASGRGRGPAGARNLGWRAARGQLVAFTDDDCEPDPAWLEAGLAAAATTPGAIVQGRTRPIEREATRLGPRARTKWIEGAGPWFQTCNIFYPRAVLIELGGFDERFTRPFGEDVDLAWRALERGVSARFAAEALVHHAVERLGALEYVRSGLRDPDEALVFKRHPRLRREVGRLAIFKSDHHALLPLAAAGPLLSRRSGAAVSALPYALHLALRARSAGAGPMDIPLIIAHDALELISAGRGALRHRVLFL